MRPVAVWDQTLADPELQLERNREGLLGESLGEDFEACLEAYLVEDLEAYPAEDLETCAVEDLVEGPEDWLAEDPAEGFAKCQVEDLEQYLEEQADQVVVAFVAEEE